MKSSTVLFSCILIACSAFSCTQKPDTSGLNVSNEDTSNEPTGENRRDSALNLFPTVVCSNVSQPYQGNDHITIFLLPSESETGPVKAILSTSTKYRGTQELDIGNVTIDKKNKGIRIELSEGRVFTLSQGQKADVEVPKIDRKVKITFPADSCNWYKKSDIFE